MWFIIFLFWVGYLMDAEMPLEYKWILFFTSLIVLAYLDKKD